MSLRITSATASVVGLVVLLAGAGPAEAASAEYPQSAEIIWRPKHPSPPKDLEFTGLRSQMAAGQVKLSNGELIKDPKLWSAVAIAKQSDEQYCTAVVIGPHVLLTAAHCVDAKVTAQPGKTVGGVLRLGGPKLNLADCTMPREYFNAPLPADDSPRTSDDFALCEIMNGSIPEGVTLESLAENAGVQQSVPILMSGYGCINIRVFAGEIIFDNGEKKLRVGSTNVDAVNVLNAGMAGGQYIRTRAGDKEPILCPGDSGAPVFSGVTLENQGGPRRRVVAVNSKVTAVPVGGHYEFLSFMASTSAPTFNSLLSSWSSQTKRGDGTVIEPGRRKVCGRDILPGSQNCRV